MPYANKQAQKLQSHRSLPMDNQSLSFWQQTTRGFPFLHANQDQPVPPDAKYVIIGSGLAGSLTAWSLIQGGVPGADILILEARQAVSGASGRNAGHVRPDAFRGFPVYARIHGDEQARSIIENEKLVFERLSAFVKEHNIPCDFNSTTTLELCLTPEFAAFERDSWNAYRAAGGDVSHVRYFEGEEARTRTKVQTALAAYEWPAGSSHPAKLVQWLLERLVEKGVRLWTHCPAQAVEPHEGSCATGATARWDVLTPRGKISAFVVVHCTNAYAAYLLPHLSTFLTPNRAQAHSVKPTSWTANNPSEWLSNTMSCRHGLYHYFSLIQRRADGAAIFGASRGTPDWSDATREGIVTFDDTSYNPEIANRSRDALARYLPGVEEVAQQLRRGEGDYQVWSGIVGLTPDLVPLVGEVEGSQGQWIFAGCNGHGMARIFTCAPALAKLILGEPWSAIDLPECFRYTRERVERYTR